MSHQVATEEAVFAACTQIATEGRTPTSASIIAMTGGSKGTVLKHLKNWQEHDKKNRADTVSIPAFLQDAINKVIGQSIQDAVSTLQAELQTSNDLQREALQALDESEERILSQKTDLSAAQEQVTSLLHTREMEAAVAAEALSGLKERVLQLEREQADLVVAAEAARTETATTRMQLDHVKQVIAKTEEKNLALEQQTVTLMTGKTEAEKGKAVAEHHADDLAVQITRLEHQLENLATTVAQLNESNVCCARDLSIALSAQNRAEGFVEQLQLRIAEYTSVIGLLRHELETTRKEATDKIEQLMLR